MAALTETGGLLTEFGGQYSVFGVKLDGTTATDGTLTIEEFDSIVSVVACLAQAPTADCVSVAVTTVSTNVITFQLQESDGTICTQNPLDFYVIAIGAKETV